MAAISGGTTTTRHSARSITKIDDDDALPSDHDVEHATSEVASHEVDLLRPKRAGQDAHAGAVVHDVLPQDLVEVAGRRLRGAGDRAGGDEVGEQRSMAERR